MSYPAPCLLGNRLNAFRLNYMIPHVFISIDGEWSGPGDDQRVQIDSMSISDRLNEVPNTLIATVRGVAPVEGQAIRVAVGSRAATALFGGTIIRLTRAFKLPVTGPEKIAHHIEATDPTWALNAQLVTARYRTMTATAIATALMAYAPSGYTLNVETGLPVIDEITFTNSGLMDAFVQLARRIGGYTRCDYDARVHLVTSATGTLTPPAPLVLTSKTLATLQYTRDLTQFITRVIVEGGGVNATADIAPGDTVIPVQSTSWYSATGGVVTSGPQRIQYGNIDPGGAGAIVGSGVAPTSAPALVIGGGAGIEVGVHDYAYTFVTASGETKPSPIATITTQSTPATPSAGPTYLGLNTTPVFTANPAIGYVGGASVRVALVYTYVEPSPFVRAPLAGEPVGALSPIVGPIFLGTNSVGGPTGLQLTFAQPPVGSGVKEVLLYMSMGGGPWYYCNFGSFGAAPGGAPTTNTNCGNPSAADPQRTPTAAQRVTVNSVAVGASGTTSRKLYRSAAGLTALKLLTTLADNTTTSYADSAADSALGAASPTTDTSGLTQPQGRVDVGSTTLTVTGTGAFRSTGGWARVGNQVIRYTGLSATSLTGIPATGNGAILSAIPYNTTVNAAPMLVGIPAAGAGAILWAIASGDAIDILVTVDDPTAQGLLAALMGSGTGVRESFLQDRRISITEATARAHALLESNARVLEVLAHRSRDARTQSGALVTVDMDAPVDIHGTYRLQDVGISGFHPRGLVGPIYDARSSSQLYTFEDLLRRIADTTPPPATGEER